MKLLVIFAVCLFIGGITYGQNLYKTANGKVRFFSDALLEDIEATTHKASAALDVGHNQIAVLIPIKSFVFDKTLMREHFNENYLESDKYLNSTFTGKLSEPLTLAAGVKTTATAVGSLTIHGVSQHREISVDILVNPDHSITATGKFNVTIADHKVKIPSLVFQNIAEVVEVTFELLLHPTGQP
jgi:hypothetical protein